MSQEDQHITFPQPTDWNAYGPCECSATSGQPCFYWPFTGAQMEHPHTGRPRIDGTPPEPGPIWTNGTAPAAVRVVECPTWCVWHEHGRLTHEAHGIELLNIAVMDDELTSDVPLRVELVQALEEGAQPRVHLSIGHALYQPACVALSRTDSARLAAALITARSLQAT